jgi:predicted O-methyltransferase YrrM
MFRPDDPEQWLRTYYGADLAELTIYDQNTPGLVEKSREVAANGALTEISLHAEICLMRIPQAQYILPALEMVWPKQIIECGVGGNMGASTAVFLEYCERYEGKLWSCDRNDPSLTGRRFEGWRDQLWYFYQMDSVEFLCSTLSPDEPDLIFIDTIHSYDHTMKELAVARAMTDAILMDDAEYPGFIDGVDGNLADLSPMDRADHGSSEPGGVKRAIKEFLATEDEWQRIDVGHPNVALLVTGELA